MDNLEQLFGQKINNIRPIYDGVGNVYMLEIFLTDNVLKIDFEHSQEKNLEWKIEKLQ